MSGFMQINELTSFRLDGRIDIRKMICINIILIAIIDSYLVYNSILIFKLFTYGLKLLNVLAMILLLQKNTIANYLLLLSIFPIWWAYYNEDSYLISFQLLFSGIFPLMTFALLKEEDRYYIAEGFIKVFVFLLKIGIPIYFLINIIGIPPLFSIQRGEVGIGRVYDNYLLFYWTRYGVENRFSSIFDEPGVVGTIAIIILFYYREMLSRKDFIVLFISGLLSFSLFFMIVALPVLYFSNLRSLPKQAVVFKVVFVFFFFAFAYLLLVFGARSTKNDPLLANKVYHRFEWQDDWIVGVVNNRDATVKGFESEYMDFVNSANTQTMVGKGKDYMLKEYGGSTLSYRVFVLERGILITIYILGLYMSFHSWRRNMIFNLVSSVLILLVFFQRPGIFTINYFLLFFVGLQYYTRQFNKSTTLSK